MIFVLKTKYQADKTELEKKIPDMSNLVGKAKLTELENKIPSNLVKKHYNTKVTEIEKKLTNHDHDMIILQL